MVWRCFYALSLLTVYFIDAVNCECLKKSSYGKYKDNHKVSKDDVEDDWGKTHGPYKMIEGGNGGPALTEIDGGAIRGKFRKGVTSVTSQLLDVLDTRHPTCTECREDQWLRHWVHMVRPARKTTGGGFNGIQDQVLAWVRLDEGWEAPRAMWRWYAISNTLT